MTVEKQANKNNIQWRDRLQREILRFNGKVLGPADGESISDATSDVRSSQKTGAAAAGKPKSALKNQPSSAAAQQVKFKPSAAAPAEQHPEVDEAIAALNSTVCRKDSGDSINFRDTGFDPEHGGIHRRNDSGSMLHPVAVGDSFGYSGDGGDHT